MEDKMVSFGGSSQSSSSKPTRVPLWTKQQKEIARELAPIIRTGLQGPAPTYPKELYVEQTPLEQQYLTTMGSLPQDYAAASEAIKQVMSGKIPYEIGPEFAEKFYQEAIRPTALREFQDIYLPQLKESFAGPGYWGSARALAESKAAYDLAQDLAARRAALMYQEELARRQAAEAAAQRQAQASMAMYPQTIGAMQEAGAYQRGIEQERVLADFQRWLMGEQVEGASPMMYNPYIQIALDFLGLRPFAIGQTSKSSGFGFSFGITPPIKGG